MGSCPISCPCRRGGEGVFLLAACVFAALWSRVFLGGDFGALLASVVRPPHAVPLALVIWAVVAAAGLVLLVIGLRALLREGDSAPVLSSLAAVAASAFAMWCGWYLPGAWGAAWPLASEGVYVSLIAAGGANLCLALGARVWSAGYIAAEGGIFTTIDAAPVDFTEWQEIIDRQAREIDSLIAECDRLAGDLARAGPPARELQEVLLFDGVRRAVLKVLHRDSHPGIPASEARAYDERFKKASAVFERLRAT